MMPKGDEKWMQTISFASSYIKLLFVIAIFRFNIEIYFETLKTHNHCKIQIMINNKPSNIQSFCNIGLGRSF